MSELKKCPSCEIPWQEEDTITEHFAKMYTGAGIPDYKVKAGFDTVEAAAADSAANHGCTPKTPKHFGINVVMVDGKLLECQKCKGKFHE